MRRAIGLAASTLLVVATSVVAEPWHISGCGSENEPGWRSFRAALQRASPDDYTYVPHPFPERLDDVVEDFLFFHRRAWMETPFENLPEAERRFFSLIDDQQAEFRLVRVANWSPTRCGRRSSAGFYFVLQVFDRRSGIEITRVALEESGHVAQLVHRSFEKGTELRIPGLPRLSGGRLPATSRPMPGTADPQYITVWGTLRCGALMPCVAFRDGGQVYVEHGKRLYRVALEGRRWSVRTDMSTSEAKWRLLATFGQGPEKLISFGGDVLGLAIEVEPD